MNMVQTLFGPGGALAGSPTEPKRDLSVLAKHNLLNFSALIERAEEQPSYLIEDLIACQSVNMLIGDSVLGKTPLLVQMGLCVATGAPFLGMGCSQGPVLYMDAESNIAHFRSYIERQTAYLRLPREVVDRNFVVWGAQFGEDKDYGAVSSEELIRRKVELMVKGGIGYPRLIIIDPLRPFWPAAEQKNEAASALMSALRSIVLNVTKQNELGCAIMLVHHRRKVERGKDAYRPNLLTDTRLWFDEAAGAKGLYNHVDTRLGMELAQDVLPKDKKDDSKVEFGTDTYIMTGLAKGLGNVPARFFQRVMDAEVPLAYDMRTGRQYVTEKEFLAVYDALPVSFTYGAAIQMLEALYKRGNNKTTSRFINECIDAGLLTKRGKTKGKTLYMKLTVVEVQAQQALLDNNLNLVEALEKATAAGTVQ